MIVLTTLPIFFSTLLIAAHFYRSGSLLFTVLSLLVLLLLFTKIHWVPRIITIFLILSAIEWLRTMMVFIGQYQEAGLSWIRLAIILTSVIFFTALSTLAFKTKVLKRRYGVTGTTKFPTTS
jgi:ABC-type Na+ efflux pump permease subunit